MSTEQVKTFSLLANNLDIREARMSIAAAAIANSVRLLSVEERRKRMKTSLEVTVAGHPQRLREFHKDVGGGKGDGMWWATVLGPNDNPFALDDILADLVVAGSSKAIGKVWNKWQARHDPPLDDDGQLSPTMDGVRTIVHWIWETGSTEADASGSMEVGIYLKDEEQAIATKQWPEWIKRTEALAYAQERGFEFAPQDLPD